MFAIKTCPGCVAQWSLHLPEEQMIGVRIPPGRNGFKVKHNRAVV
jgi:hypothetical protein